jgi:hypothetical protein
MTQTDETAYAAIPVPAGFESHTHFAVVNGIPRTVYFAALKAGKAPQTVADEPFDLQPPTDPADPLTAHPKWDTGWPCVYKGTTFRNYHKMCDHLEATGVIRKFTPLTPGTEASIYDIPERHVLMWLSATGRLNGPSADVAISMVVAPLRRENKHEAPRKVAQDQCSLTTCSRCHREAPPRAMVLRPLKSNDPPFTVASRRKGFDPSKYAAWCRSCVALDRWDKQKTRVDPT